MIIENKSGEFRYSVGEYFIDDSEPEKWHMHYKGKLMATFFDRDQALRVAVIQHTCGDSVSEGIRDLLKIALAEQLKDN